MSDKLCMGDSPKHRSFSGFSLGHWPILAALGAGLVAWGANTVSVAQNSERSKDNAEAIQLILQEQAAARRDRESQKEKLEDVDEGVKQIQEDIKTILQRLPRPTDTE